ncbi:MULTISPECIES: gamma-mobile-trio protein GmtX [Ramlibacter]|uniref:Alpha/beta hydrolase n=1 Tax=Ramlibacter pinisoli TaxID=2682844 RepID=A0A6N8IRW2_9BURK|nr:MULTISPECIES: gamma-mobile-trio protein GmtX [Ramlibacter]MBA2964684.1 alpha/beta hydrolase [Ramlibacter sp. CGMCC 1.13660]MVQ29649.1 alpha/beta hydrolase [Ramlibacter pinisoli]
MSKSVHPDDVLQALLKKSARSQKEANLRKLHEVCAAQYAGSRDFSLPAIGRLWQAAGGIKARALYNAPSEDYRTLIQAWADFSGPADVPPTQVKEGRRYSFLARIEDPAVRALVQGVVIERDKLEGEVNLLKSLTTLTINRAPALAATPPANAPALLPATPSANLTESERAALERSISPDFLDGEGWVEMKSGAVTKENGRTIFDPGFTKAIRKVLDAARPRD